MVILALLPIEKLVLAPGDHQESPGSILEIEVGNPQLGNLPRYPQRSHPMRRMPILIACAATLAAACGVGVGISRPGNSGELATNAPAAIASPASEEVVSTPASSEDTTAPLGRNANPGEIAATNQPAPSAKAPAPRTPAPVAPTPTASAPTASAPLPDVIRRLALQAQAEPAQPYKPQSVAIRDEIAPGSDFDRFRNQLRGAVRDRDADFLRQVADEQINLSFGRGLTLEKRLAEPNAALWKELERAIGGDCAPDGNAPNADYWACPASFVVDAYHPDIDPYMTVYVDGTDVAVRQLPSTDSPVLTRISNSILQSATLPWNESLSEAEDAQLSAWYQASETSEGWKFVSLPDGRKGFVSSRYAYGSLGYRAIFQRQDAGAWVMTAFIAGD